MQHDPKTILEYLPFAKTDRQRQAVQALHDAGKFNAAARAINMDSKQMANTLNAVKRHAATANAGEHYRNPHAIPDPYLLSGVSTYYAKDEATGRPAFWAKSKMSQAQFEAHLQSCADLFYQTLPAIPAPEVLKRQKYCQEVIPWYQIGDAHLGMLAHAAETGQNFDLKIAVTELRTAFDILFHEAPYTERCVINDLGDFTHYENFSGQTEHSGHALDLDGRFPKMIDYYIPLMRSVIDQALTRHKHVDIMINQGNHSRTNDIWMARLLAAVYDGSDRVHVLSNSNVFTPYRMGDTFVMVHHSDKCKPGSLPKVMSTDYAEDWGESRFRYIDMGHVHHGFTSKEHPGVLIESWNHLAPADKYAHEGGWRSRQAITRVDRSRRYGNVARRTLPVEEVQDRIEQGLTKFTKGAYVAPKKRKVYTV